MAQETWYVREIQVATGIYRLFWDLSSEANVAEGATTVPIGWVVAKLGAGNYANFSNGTELAGGFSTTIVPNNTAPAAGRTDTPAGFGTLYSTAVAISTMYPFNGYFPAGIWNFAFGFRAVSQANGQDGRVNIRVFKNGPNFTNATELTAAMLVGSTVTNLTTAATQFSNVTWDTGANPIILNNEYLSVKIGWEITGAGTTSNNNDVDFRDGNTLTMISPVFKGRYYSVS